MYALRNRDGDWVRMHNGQRFIYSSRATARMGARHLAKTCGWLTVVDA